MGITRKRVTALTTGFLALSILSACDESGQFNLAERLNLKGQDSDASEAGVTSDKTVEEDVEAPQVFSVTEEGLWDGRPSLGGVWVAHPDVDQPHRVMIRNTGNEKTVIGALFRKEQDLPGPRLQVSSDAAAELSLVAGTPQELQVIALQRKEVPAEVPDTDVDGEDATLLPSDVTETALDPVSFADRTIAASAAMQFSDSTTRQRAAVASGGLATDLPVAKRYIQVGSFGSQDTANRAARQLRTAGMPPAIRAGEAGGQTGETSRWRVIVGPVRSASERSAFLDRIKGEGFTDAFPVTN